MTEPCDEKERFLLKYQVDLVKLDESGLHWEVLEAIASDYDKRHGELVQVAELIAGAAQRFESVHSVRWRIKQTSHLIEKIVRKAAEKQEKYLNVTRENYMYVLGDLVGVRALHLFKQDFPVIDRQIRERWRIAEEVEAFVREGEQYAFPDVNMRRTIHENGYRSIHYTIKNLPFDREITTELQVRTIFEEGWSEIDHTVRYPNFSDNELLGYHLSIFNRLAGSADEMGSFVRMLADFLAGVEKAQESHERQQDELSTKLKSTLDELSKSVGESETQKSLVAKLESEISALRKLKGSDSLHESGINTYNKYTEQIRRMQDVVSEDARITMAAKLAADQYANAAKKAIELQTQMARAAAERKHYEAATAAAIAAGIPRAERKKNP